MRSGPNFLFLATTVWFWKTLQTGWTSFLPEHSHSHTATILTGHQMWFCGGGGPPLDSCTWTKLKEKKKQILTLILQNCFHIVTRVSSELFWIISDYLSYAQEFFLMPWTTGKNPVSLPLHMHIIPSKPHLVQLTCRRVKYQKDGKRINCYWVLLWHRLLTMVLFFTITLLIPLYSWPSQRSS